MELLEDIFAPEKSGDRLVYPVFVKKSGASELTLDVSLSGKSDSYKGMSEEKFRALLEDPETKNNYPSASVRSAVRKEQLKHREKQDRSGYKFCYFTFKEATHEESNKYQQSKEAADRVSVADERALIAIKTRRGQPAFRKALLAAFNGTCCITGCKVLEILEAAHIVPHGDETNYSVYNGLLLRADVHTLFDLELLSISNAGLVIVDSSIKNSEYFQYDGVRIMNDELPKEMTDNLHERQKNFKS